jgi:hypothetical protein
MNRLHTQGGRAMIPSDPYHDPEPGEERRAIIVAMMLINLAIWGYVSHLF